MTDEAQMEVLNQAHQTYGYARRRVDGGDLSSGAVKAEIRAINILLDACVECGMPTDQADVDAWAATRIAAWLVSA